MSQLSAAKRGKFNLFLVLTKELQSFVDFCQ